MIGDELEIVQRKVTSIGGTILLGGAMTAIFLGVFSAWAYTVPLSGAIIARGNVVTESNIQVVRHERGGVLTHLAIREGMRVNRGDILATLSRAEDQATVSELETRITALRIRQERLNAEMRSEPKFPADVNDLHILRRDASADETQMFEDQAREFSMRKTQLGDSLDVLKSQRNALLGQIAGQTGELASLRKQRDSMATDIDLRQRAVQNGLGRESLLRELERQSEALVGNIARTEAAIDALRHQVAETDKRMEGEVSGFHQKVSEEISKVRSEYLEAGEALKGKLAATERVEIRTPVAGVVNKLHVYTIGSAVEPFSPLFEIVPEDQPLLIEAKIDPSDIDDAYLGQSAHVIISAFNRHLYDQIAANVTFVGADARQDRADLPPHYTIRLSVDESQLSNIPAIMPGMPAEVFLTTHQRTFFEYLLEPFVQSFRRAFRQ